MPYNPKHVSRALRICFPIMVTIIAGFIAPMSVSLVGFLMFGNLLRECGCLERLSQTAQNDLANLITLLLGITISFSIFQHALYLMLVPKRYFGAVWNALPIQRIGDVLVRCSGTVEGEQHLNDPLLFRNDLQCAATDLVSI